MKIEGQPSRRSIRSETHKYSWSGSYFVTILANEGAPTFETPELCVILEEAWKVLPERFSYLTLDEFVIMPDHVHFIVHLKRKDRLASSLGRVVGAYKSLAAVAWIHHLNTLGTEGFELSGHIWQRDYYERVIRDDTELEYTRRYIRNNPAKLLEKRMDAQ